MQSDARSSNAAPAAVTAGGYTMAIRCEGSGQPVVCLHSGGLTSRQWHRLRHRMAPRLRILLPDFIGYGDSSPWPEGKLFDIEHDTALVEALLGQLDEPAHVVGHSYGALMGMRAALRRPDRVRSLVLFEPIAFGVLFDGRHEAEVASLPWPRIKAPTLPAAGREAWLRDFVDWWTGAGAWDRLGEDARHSFRQTASKLYGEVRSMGRDRTPAAAYATLRMPALVMTAEHSPPAARRVAQILAAAMPNARLLDIPDAGHMAPVTHHATVNAEIEGFLQALTS